MGLEDIKEVKSLSGGRYGEEAANKLLDEGSWRLLKVEVAPSYLCVQYCPEKIYKDTYAVVYVLGRYK